MSGRRAVRVVIADDHPVVREGVATVLSNDPGIEVVAQVPTAEEAVAAVATREPEVLVIDVRMGTLDGVEACARVSAEHARTRTLVLTRFAHESVMMRAFSAGAAGFLVKEASPEVLRKAVHVVAGGQVFLDSRVAGKLVDVATKGRRAKGPYELTIMEMRVLELLPKGLSNREIGAELNVSYETAKTHVRHIMEKLGVSDRSEAASVAIREGLA